VLDATVGEEDDGLGDEQRKVRRRLWMVGSVDDSLKTT
jgi:hypothetical protein